LLQPVDAGFGDTTPSPPLDRPPTSTLQTSGFEESLL